MSDGPIVLPDRETWLRFRREHIGGSDISSILGVNPHRSCYTTWAIKTGRLQEPDVDNEAALWGRVLEEPVAQEYARRTGRTLINPGPWTVRVHADLPFVAVTIDREIIDPARGDGDPGCYEGKTTSFFLGRDWNDAPPLMPQVQTQHGLMVTGWGWGSVACLIGGQRFEPHDVERDEALIEMMEDRCRWFWDLVESGTAPPVDDSESTENTLRALHPKDNGARVALPAEAADWARELADVGAQIKRLQAREKGLKNSIRAAIGDATYGDLPDRSCFSLKHQSRDGYEVAPAEFRVLRHHQPKLRRAVGAASKPNLKLVTIEEEGTDV